VFKAWTDPDHPAHRWGPKGFTNTFHEFDLRPGGIWRFLMHGPDGVDFKNKSVFVEVVKPEAKMARHPPYITPSRGQSSRRLTQITMMPARSSQSPARIISRNGTKPVP